MIHSGVIWLVRLVLSEASVFFPLGVYPFCQLWIGLESLRNRTMPMVLLLVHKLIETFLPSITMCFPHKTNLFQGLLAFVGESRMLAVVLDLVLIALPLGPPGKALVWREIVWNHGMTKFLCKILNLLKSQGPALCLVRAKSKWTLSPRLLGHRQ